MNDRRIAAVAALTTIVLGGVRLGVELAGTRIADGLLAGGAAPTVGTMGQTVTLYVYTLGALGPLVTVAVTVGLGLYVGRLVDLRTAHRELLTAVAAGSGAVAVVAGVAGFVAGGPLSVYGVLFGAATALRAVATLTLPLLVGTLAGAALVTFEREDDDGNATVDPVTPTDEGDVERAGERSADHASAD